MSSMWGDAFRRKAAEYFYFAYAPTDLVYLVSAEGELTPCDRRNRIQWPSGSHLHIHATRQPLFY
jgi:hypothetical protein